MNGNSIRKHETDGDHKEEYIRGGSANINNVFKSNKIKQEEIIGNNIEIHKSKTNFIRNITLNKYDFQNTFKNSEIDIKNQNITNFNNQMIFKNSCYSLKPISINGFEILTWVKN